MDQKHKKDQHWHEVQEHQEMHHYLPLHKDSRHQNQFVREVQVVLIENNQLNQE